MAASTAQHQEAMTWPLSASTLSDEAILVQLRAIVGNALRPYPATVRLFGSWAHDAHRRTSDIDIAVWSDQPLPPGVLSELRERIEDSTIPYRVDVVDLEEVDPQFRARVLEEGITWSAC